MLVEKEPPCGESWLRACSPDMEKHMRLRIDVYDTAKRLEDGAIKENKVTMQNVREVVERGGGITKPKSYQVCICTEIIV